MFEYTADTTDATNKVTAEAVDGAAATIEVNGSAHTSGQSATWDEGENEVEVTVVNGTTSNVYTVTVTKTTPAPAPDDPENT